jgi:adenylate cyclase
VGHLAGGSAALAYSSPIEPDQLTALGLYDPEADNAGDRLALLGFLLEQGASVDEMVEADRNGRLAGLAGDRLVRPGRARLTLGEVATRSGVSPELVARLRRSLGFPDPGPDAAAFSEADVETVRFLGAACDLLGETVGLDLARVLSSHLARIAEAIISAVGMYRDAPLIAAGASELEAAQAAASNVALLPQVSQAMDTVLRHHVEAANNRRFELAFPVPGADTVDLAVGFADLVGYTAMAEQLSTAELATAMAAFEGLVFDLITAEGGRLVKLIGDEVMFVANDATEGCAILLRLLDELAADEVLPQMRGGLAAGKVLVRDGDYYGSVVNLASRAVKVARPNTALVTNEVRERVAESHDAYHFTSVDAGPLKGLATPVPLFGVRRA